MRVRDQSLRQRPAWLIFPLWIVAVVAFFTWQAGAYRGVVALLAEWQFNEFGVYHPLLTFLVFVLILAPLPFLFTRRRRKAAVVAASAAVPAATFSPVRNDMTRAIGDATRFLQMLAVGAVGCMFAALIACVMLLLLPSARGPIQRISASTTRPDTPSQGLTELRGGILYTRTSAFDEDLLLTRRNVRFAPMIEAGADPSEVRYFVELSPTDGSSRTETTSIRQGILVKDALPGELFRLYRYAGFRVTPTHYVLFRSTATMRWPYWIWALEFGIAGLVIALGAMIQWLRRRRLIVRQRRLVAELEA